ncbi:MAG: VOC family protein [Polyangiales bacterium]
MSVKAIPEGFHSVTPYLLVKDGAKLIEFVESAFGAEQVERLEDPDGTVRHAQVKIGDSFVMLGTPQGEPMPSSLYLYVPDCDAVYAQALAAGATSIMEPADQFYGDRGAGVTDPCGNLWWIGTHIEDVSHEELQRRAAEARN